VQCPCSLC
jgi:hypothetical protein